MDLGPPSAPFLSPRPPPYPSPTPPRATHLPTPPYTQSPGSKRRLHTRRRPRRPGTPPTAAIDKETRRLSPAKCSARRKAPRAGRRGPSRPPPNRVFPSSSPGQVPARNARQPPSLDSAPCAPIGRRSGPRLLFLESSWKFVKGVSSGGPTAPDAASAPPPARAPRGPAARPAVLGRRRFREGLGRGGQKIRRLAPPRPPGPPPAPSRPARAGAAQSAPAARAPRLPAGELAPRSRASLQPSPAPGCRRRCRDMVLCVQG